MNLSCKEYHDKPVMRFGSLSSIYIRQYALALVIPPKESRSSSSHDDSLMLMSLYFIQRWFAWS